MKFDVKKIVREGVYAVIAALLLFGLGCLAKGLTHEKTESYPVVCLGDSMFGMVRGETGIVHRLEEQLNVPVLNGAFGGSCLSRIYPQDSLSATGDTYSMVALVEAIAYDDFGPQQTIVVNENGTDYFDEAMDLLSSNDFSQTELLLIEHGVNDYCSGVPLSNELDDLDPFTYKGALRRALSLLQQQKPKLRILMVTPTFCWLPAVERDCTSKNTVGLTLADYVAAQEEVAEEMGVELLNHYDLFPHEEDAMYLYTIDGLHANDLGNQMIADSIVRYLKQK